MKQSEFPPGWDSERVKRVLAYYESQSEEEAVAEDEAAYEALGQASDGRDLSPRMAGRADSLSLGKENVKVKP
jgi:hypothetical protein